MKSENIYIVWAHPRTDSLTARVVEEIQGGGRRSGYAQHYTGLVPAWL
ncbi:Uncharacterised protein [Shimwellia blattae]|nr:Uncharacterised protein [Shimwellia blattae]